MERALVNLLSNALKFTDPGGRVKVWMDANDDEVQIGVQDSGIGIPQDQLERDIRAISAKPTDQLRAGTGELASDWPRPRRLSSSRRSHHGR